MKSISLYLLIPVLLGACASEPTKTQTAAQVEDRTLGQKPPAPPTADVKPLVPPPQPSISPLKDPNNILSQRSLFYDLDSFDVKPEYKTLVDAHGNYLANNPNFDALFTDYPRLTMDDVKACLAFAQSLVEEGGRPKARGKKLPATAPGP